MSGRSDSNRQVVESGISSEELIFKDQLQSRDERSGISHGSQKQPLVQEQVTIEVESEEELEILS